LTQAGVTAVAVVLACCLLVWKRWKHRFRTFGSGLIKTPAYRVLFVLVLIGILLIATLPEAAMVLPVLDSVGLDVVTILVAFELRHYLASVARLVGMPTIRVTAQVGNRCGNLLRTKPVLWLYACMWPLIWLRTRGIH
jgi:hypothetical protein